MDIFYIDLIGVTAGVLTTVSFIPQIVKILGTKHAKDISLAMYLVLTAGVLLWLVYGLLLARPPIILANAVTLVFCFTVIFAKIFWDRHPRR